MKKILIADDEPHIIRIIRLALERAGYQIDSAPNGEAALEKIHQQHPDILITDIQMPRMTGEELCKKINNEISERKFLIVVSTSRTEIEHREWSQEIPNLMFLEKPVSTRKLLSVLDDYFSNDETIKKS